METDDCPHCGRESIDKIKPLKGLGAFPYYLSDHLFLRRVHTPSHIYNFTNKNCPNYDFWIFHS